MSFSPMFTGPIETNLHQASGLVSEGSKVNGQIARNRCMRSGRVQCDLGGGHWDRAVCALRALLSLPFRSLVDVLQTVEFENRKITHDTVMIGKCSDHRGAVRSHDRKM